MTRRCLSEFGWGFVCDSETTPASSTLSRFTESASETYIHICASETYTHFLSHNGHPQKVDSGSLLRLLFPRVPDLPKGCYKGPEEETKE